MYMLCTSDKYNISRRDKTLQSIKKEKLSITMENKRFTLIRTNEKR